MPQDFELLAQRKGFKRFMSPALRCAVVARQAALDAREVALTGSLQVPHVNRRLERLNIVCHVRRQHCVH